jgi:hypothetical protein
LLSEYEAGSWVDDTDVDGFNIDYAVTSKTWRELKSVVLASGSSIGLDRKPVLPRLEIVKKFRALGYFRDRRATRVYYGRGSVDISR